jgi:hypothetical protein
MLVFSDPVAGEDAAFDAWYSGRHLDDICAMPGFSAAQRFRLHSVPMGQCGHRHLAIYDMETDDPDGVVEHMFSLRDTEAMPMSPAFDMDTVEVLVFEENGALVASRKG